MEYLSEEIRERFASSNSCPTFLEPQSVENVNEQEIYSDGERSEPRYYDLSDKQYSSANFSSHFADESSRGYSEFNFITQMPLEVHIKSEDYEEYVPQEDACREVLQCCTELDQTHNEYIMKTEMKRRRKAERQKYRRSLWDDEKRRTILERERARQRERRANFSIERRQRELEIGRLRQRSRRALYTQDELERERELNKQRQRERRVQMSEEQRHKELEISKSRQKQKRAIIRETKYGTSSSQNSTESEIDAHDLQSEENVESAECQDDTHSLESL